MRRLLAVAALAAVAVVGPAPGVSAAPAEPAQGINIVPDPSVERAEPSDGVTELGQVAPGQTVRDAFLVRSSFDEPREVVLHAADAQPAVGGGFGFSGRDQPQKEVGSWIVLGRQRVTVPPGGSVSVPYTVVVPKTVEGGEYVGGIVAEAVEESHAGGLQTQIRFAMAVYLRVPGGAPGATPGRGDPGGGLVLEDVDPGFDGSRSCPVVRYRNDSQDVVDPVATVTAAGPLGTSSYTKRRVGALLPEASAEVALPCVERALGTGRVAVELSSPRGGGRESVPYSWFPGPFVLSLLLILLLVGALVATFLRSLFRQRRTGREVAPLNAEGPSPL